MARVLIGTSGWHYASWRGPFFPKGLPPKRQLDYYASQFRTTELNGVFYRTPTEKAVTSWREAANQDFIFAWKASKFITHWKRLSENSINSLELLEDRLSLLRDKAGPILFQLPPNFTADADRLASFLKLLKRRRRYAFEFRHPSWYEPRILKILAARNMALCISDHHDAPSPWKRTADFVYIRGHGPGGRYRGHYEAAELSDWAKRIRGWKRQGCDVYVYFDNDQKSAAPADASRLCELLGSARPSRHRNEHLRPALALEKWNRCDAGRCAEIHCLELDAQRARHDPLLDRRILGSERDMPLHPTWTAIADRKRLLRRSICCVSSRNTLSSGRLS